MTLYLTDLDGTLLNYAGKIKPRAAGMLNRMISKGVLFSYATARGFLSSRRLTSELQLKLPIITMNGAIICDPDTGARVATTKLSPETDKIAREYFTEHKETPLVYSFIDGVERVGYLENDTKCIRTYLRDRKGDARLRPCRDYAELFDGEIFYYCVINSRSGPEAMNKAFGTASGCAVNYQEDTYNKGEFWYEIFDKDVSKANAMRKLKELAGADRVVVFGDNVNDLSMFEAADECYAVANARPQVKAAATGIIGSNEAMGVPVFIEKATSPVFDYLPKPEIFVEPDERRFQAALDKALARERSGESKIGTLNEKLIHATLKGYFAEDMDHEAKIGPYYADAVAENGIYEIQTAGWDKLNDKLDCFLDVCHVTVVYPYEKRVHTSYIHEQTGELIKKSKPGTARSMTKFFLELYRIKSFLTNPNLSICIAELELEKLRHVSDEACKRRRRQRVDKLPVKLLREIYIQKPEDFRIFLPENLPAEFDKKCFCKLAKNSDGSILLALMEYFGFVHKVGKTGNSFIYSADQVAL